MKKNKIRFLLFLIVSIFIFPIVVLAVDEGNRLAGNELTSPGSKLTIDIKVASNVPFKKYEADLSYETNVLELVEIENKNSWTGT